MPLYEYECPWCQRREEVLQKHGAPGPVCPHHSRNVEMVRVPSAPHFNLKGEGFYKPGAG
jgi:putative FmdB family regulatory protein